MLLNLPSCFGLKDIKKKYSITINIINEAGKNDLITFIEFQLGIDKIYSCE